VFNSTSHERYRCRLAEKRFHAYSPGNDP
jgi:hypothetical protein